MVKYNVGDKVVPIKKTVENGKDLAQCHHYEGMVESGQGFLYVANNNYYFNGKYVLLLNREQGSTNGNFYNFDDVIPYVESPPKGGKPLSFNLKEESSINKDIIKFIEANDVVEFYAKTSDGKKIHIQLP